MINVSTEQITIPNDSYIVLVPSLGPEDIPADREIWDTVSGYFFRELPGSLLRRFGRSTISGAGSARK